MEVAVFTPVGKRQLLSKDVEQQIERAIISRTIPGGQKLPSENELADQFGVSRTAVREALRTLDTRGLVRTVKGKGVFVKDVSAEFVTGPLHSFLRASPDSTDAINLIHARQIIEPAIAAAAAAERTEADLWDLRENLNQLSRSAGDKVQMTKLDLQFHLRIAQSTGSQILPLILEPIQRLFPPVKHLVYDHVPDAHASAVEWHGHIFDAIASGDPARARAAMTAHLGIAEEHIRKAAALEDLQSRKAVEQM